MYSDKCMTCHSHAIGCRCSSPDDTLRRLYAEQHRGERPKQRSVRLEGGTVLHPDDRGKRADGTRYAGKRLTWKPQPLCTCIYGKGCPVHAKERK